MPELNIAELRRLEAEATPGPWKTDGAYVQDDEQVIALAYSPEKCEADAALIVAMRNALPELLKALEAARELADWCEFEVGADTGLTPGLETLREYLPPHGGVDVG